MILLIAWVICLLSWAMVPSQLCALPAYSFTLFIIRENKMKLTTKQIRQIIREEIKDTLSEASPQSELGLPHKFTSEELIAVFEKQLNTPGHKIRSDKEYIEKAADQITNKMRKEPNKETRLKLRALREKIEEYTDRGRKRAQSALARKRASDRADRAATTQKYKDQDPTQRIQRGYWGENKMKLGQIIQEEYKKLLKEYERDHDDQADSRNWGTPFGQMECEELAYILAIRDEDYEEVKAMMQEKGCLKEPGSDQISSQPEYDPTMGFEEGKKRP